MSQCDSPRTVRPVSRPDVPDLRRLKLLAISDSGFVFDPVSGLTFNINSTGLAAIRALKDGVSPADLPRTLSDAYDSDGKDDFVNDVEDFLSQLTVHGLLVSAKAG